ncbi:lens fiber major intrinsic protein [Drosophila eugracilis]|uniref:lens fiber major intrinsic protein n=1 Tax=Drosophila eugracilis TaxID=29029 RepID=UPI0007E75098|nr:lens fiber major intrinsic protein [Drosophila eugracilis]
MIWDFFTFIRGLSEFGATAVLMIVGCMGESMNQGGENNSLVASVHYGLTVMLVMHIFGIVSGAHANPSISIACYFMGYIASEMMVMYVACQMAGGLAGYYLLLQLLPKDVVDNSKPAVCMLEPMDSLSTIQIVAIECLLTAVFVLGWCALWDVRNGRYLDSVTIRMGLLVTTCCLAGAKLTGASMNPVRTLVPAIFQGNPDSVVMQLTGQILAGVMVPFVWTNAYTPHYKPLEIPICRGQN